MFCHVCNRSLYIISVETLSIWKCDVSVKTCNHYEMQIIARWNYNRKKWGMEDKRMYIINAVLHFRSVYITMPILQKYAFNDDSGSHHIFSFFVDHVLYYISPFRQELKIFEQEKS